MKTTFFKTVLLSLLLLLLSVACKEDNDQQQDNLRIDLLTPGKTALVTPDDVPLTFSWKKSEGTGATTLYISVDAAFPGGNKTLVHEAGDGVSYALAEAAYEALLVAGGVGYGESTTVHWKVEAAGAAAESSFLAYRGAEPVTTITLKPQEGALDANTLTEPPVFEWTVTGVTFNAYTLKFSTDESFPATTATKSYDVQSASYTFASVDAFDRLLGDIGITTQGRVYWTVVPGETFSHTLRPITPSSFTAARLSRLKSPTYDAAAIVTNDLQGNFVMEWQASSGVSSYNVVIATDEGLQNALISRNVSATTLSIPWSELQDKITDPQNNFKRYKKNVLYWTVKVNNAPITETPGRFNLYGQRIFVDNRAAIALATYPDAYNPARLIFNDSPQTYTVAVVEYNGKEVVWLAEDLRANSIWNQYWSDPMGIRANTERQQYLVTEDGCVKTDLPAAYYNRTTPPVGYYYDQDYMHDVIPRSETDWDTKLWRLPVEADFNELFEAANAAYGGNYSDNVIRHPDFITGDKTHANEWGLNMLGNGAFTYGRVGCNNNTVQVWSERSIYYFVNANGIGNDPGKDKCYHYYGSGTGYYVGSVYNGCNVRVIYTGDEE